MFVLAIANQKGGVGKTTTAAAFSQGLTAKGYHVLTVDADAQGNLTALLQAGDSPTLYDVFTRRVDLQKAIMSTEKAGDLVRGDSRLSSKGLLSGKNETYALKRILQAVGAQYDVCIIDCPPELGNLTEAALIAAQGIIVPLRADRFSLQGLQEIHSTVQQARRAANPALTIVGIVVTQFNSRATLNKDMLSAIEKQAGIYNTHVILPPIRRTVSAEAWQFTGNVYGDDSTAGDDYRAIVDQLPQLLNLGRV